MKTEILNSIDDASITAELHVLESMAISLNKVILIEESANDDSLEIFSIIQESASSNTDEKKTNAFTKVIDLIISFFKNIGKSIASFFKKANDSVTKKLRSFSKRKEKSTTNATDTTDTESSSNDAEEDESEADNTNESTSETHDDLSDLQEKIDAISEKASEKLDKQIEKENVDNSLKATIDDGSKSDKSDDNNTKESTGINIKSKTIRSRIKFTEWIKYLKDTSEFLDELETIKPDKNIKKAKVGANKSKLYFSIAHKNKVDVVADYVDEIIKLMDSVNLKITKVSHKLDEYKKRYLDPVFDTKKENKIIAPVLEKITVISTTVHAMTLYMAEELKLYNVLIDTIESSDKYKRRYHID